MKKNYSLIIVVLVVMMAIISIATYAYFATGILNVTNVANLNVVTERNNMVFDTLGGEMSLNVTAANMAESLSGNVAAENNTTLTVNFTANTDYSMVCTYDIVYEWTSSDKYTTHTSGVSSNEFTIQGTLASNAHLYEGTNSISSETDLSTLSYTNYSATVISGAQIDGTGNTMSTAVWTLTSKFYNVSQDQSLLSGKTYTGRFKVANVSCVSGTVTGSNASSYSYWFVKDEQHTFPDYGGTLQTSGLATGHYVYIAQDSSKYYACGNDGNGHEVCLSQPYTQYGIGEHTYLDYFTDEQEESGKLAIYQAFIDAGINANFNECVSGGDYIGCYINGVNCGIDTDGTVTCNRLPEYDTCMIYRFGRAICQ